MSWFWLSLHRIYCNTIKICTQMQRNLNRFLERWVRFSGGEISYKAFTHFISFHFNFLWFRQCRCSWWKTHQNRTFIVGVAQKAAQIYDAWNAIAVSIKNVWKNAMVQIECAPNARRKMISSEFYFLMNANHNDWLGSSFHFRSFNVSFIPKIWDLIKVDAKASSIGFRCCFRFKIDRVFLLFIVCANTSHQIHAGTDNQPHWY